MTVFVMFDTFLNIEAPTYVGAFILRKYFGIGSFLMILIFGKIGA